MRFSFLFEVRGGRGDVRRAKTVGSLLLPYRTPLILGRPKISWGILNSMKLILGKPIIHWGVLKSRKLILGRPNISLGCKSPRNSFRGNQIYLGEIKVQLILGRPNIAWAILKSRKLILGDQIYLWGVEDQETHSGRSNISLGCRRPGNSF